MPTVTSAGARNVSSIHGNSHSTHAASTAAMITSMKSSFTGHGPGSARQSAPYNSVSYSRPVSWPLFCVRSFTTFAISSGAPSSRGVKSTNTE